MGRKNQIQPYLSVSAGDMSQASITGSETVVAQTDVVNVLVSWSGAQSSNGTFKIQAWTDSTIGWHDLDFGNTINLDTSSGSHQLIIQQVSFLKIRPVYTRVNGSATGSLNVVVFATTIGA